MMTTLTLQHVDQARSIVEYHEEFCNGNAEPNSNFSISLQMVDMAKECLREYEELLAH